MADGPVTVFGGSGFLGRRVVERLSAAGIPVRIATRRPHGTGGAEALRGARKGSVEWTRADVQDKASVAAAVAGSRGVVNAVSLYAESGGPTFRSVHVEGARSVALQSMEAGIPTLVHVSGLGADPRSSSLYIRCRAEGEAAVRASFDRPTILRPSVMFGADDAFLNGLVRAVSLFPVVPLFGLGATRLHPVWVGDAAAAAASLFDGGADRAEVYELGGPRVVSDHQYRFVKLSIEAIHQIEHFFRGNLVEIAGRFVGNQNRGIRGDGPRDRHPLLLPAGELARVVMHPLSQADNAQRRFRVRPSFFF